MERLGTAGSNQNTPQLARLRQAAAELFPAGSLVNLLA